MRSLKTLDITHTNKIIILLLLCLLASESNADTSIAGIKGDVEDNVMLMLSIQNEKCNSPKWKIKGLFEKSDQEIDQALRAFGYYHSTLKKTLVFNKDCWKADFKINPGQQVTVSNVDILIKGDAKDDPDFSNLLKNLPLKQGNPLHHGHYETMKNKIVSLALDNGYLQGKFIEKKLLIDKQNNTADIKLTFESGNRMVFGDVTLQQDVLDDEFVKKYLSIKSGDIYTNAQLAKTHNALFKSGYFDSVDIRSDLEHVKNQRIPVIIKLTAKKKAHYGLGVGFDTDIGPILNASYINRRINHKGHFITSNFDLSPVLSTAEVEYSIPLDKPTTDFLSFGGGLKREHTDTFKSMSATISGRHKHAYANGWKQTIFLDYNYEDFTTASDSGQTLLLVPGGSWLYSVSNNPLRPTEGYRLEFEAKGSYENPISDVSCMNYLWVENLLGEPYKAQRLLIG
jgi:translocation and assembly module TamA